MPIRYIRGKMLKLGSPDLGSDEALDKLSNIKHSFLGVCDEQFFIRMSGMYSTWHYCSQMTKDS